MTEKLMPETTTTYLRRVLPDITSLADQVQAALNEPQGRRYSLSAAVGTTQKLLSDLMRAEKADV